MKTKKKRQSREIFSFSESSKKKAKKKSAIFCLLKNKKATDRHMREERDLVYFLIKSSVDLYRSVGFV